MKDNKPMDENQVRSFIGRKVGSALNAEDGDLSQKREDSLDRYLGELYGDERDGYSKFTTREVMETIEWIKPNLLRVFASGDKVVVFDAVGMEDEEAAEQETEIVNHKILKANDGDGFLAFYSWFSDILLYPNGYIKVYIEETEKVETENYTGLNDIALAEFVNDPQFEIVGQEVKVEVLDTPQGPMQVELFDIEVKRKFIEKKLKIVPVPPEQCLVDNDLTTQNLDMADFICHRVQKSYTQLVNEGFDRDKLDEVGAVEDYSWNDETTSRLFYEDENPDATADDDHSMRSFWVHECYCNLDVDGDGLGEFRRITMVGGEIFENEEVSYQPIVSASSILMTHKHTGLSYTDIIQDIQKLKTTLLRQLLDNIYKINVRRKYINEDSMLPDGSTVEAMANVQTEHVPVRGQPQMAVMPEQAQSIIGEILPVIDWVDNSRTVRTGVSPNTAVDPNVLQDATKGAFMASLEKASERVELLIRVIAETGMKRLMRKVHQLVRMNPDIAETMKLRNDWVQVDPSGWRERTDMTVNVGLGFSNKEQQAMMAQMILQIQREAMEGGMSTPDEIFNTLEKLINATDFGDVSQFFVDPQSPKGQELAAKRNQPPPPDPAMMMAQAQSQAMVTDSQTKQMAAQADAQAKQAKAQADQAKQSEDSKVKLAQVNAENLKTQLAREQFEWQKQKDEAENARAERRSEAEIRKIVADTIKALEDAEKAQPGDQVPDELIDVATQTDVSQT